MKDYQLTKILSDMPKISVVIPLYNKEGYIKNTIDSVLNQSFADFEVIVVNDGSKDNSAEIVSSINDVRIHLVTQNNDGVSSARNRGILEANGDYILFLDADDSLSESALENLNQVIEEHSNVDLITAGFIYKNSEGNIVKINTNIRKDYVDDPFKSLWKREVFFRMGNFLIKNDDRIKN